MSKKLRELEISDEDIAFAFRGTNFGRTDHRKLLEQGVLKAQVGYSSGYTLTKIMEELGLRSPGGRVTSRGRAFLFSSFYDQRNSG